MARSDKLYDRSPELKRGEDGKVDVKKAEKAEEAGEGTPHMEKHMRHAHERRDMKHRHIKEHMDMHHKHETEHENHKEGDKAEMHGRHHEELKNMHTRHEKEMKENHGRHEKGTGGEKIEKIEKDKKE